MIRKSFYCQLPPHNSDYFSSQLKAVKNYYKKITNEIIDLEISVVDSVYTAVDSNVKNYQWNHLHILKMM